MEKYTDIGRKMKTLTGVREITRDLAYAIESGNSVVNLGAGNPLVFPEFVEMWKDCAASIDDHEYGNTIGRYGGSQGSAAFIESVCDLLNEHHEWNITPKNCLVTPGSQSLFFMLVNIFSGKNKEIDQKIYLPYTPEYTGYDGVGLVADPIYAEKPLIEDVDNNIFKYAVDFNKVSVNSQKYSCMLTSRPNNPTGSVISDGEVEKLVDLANQADIPIILDSAYGLPIPGLANRPLNYPFNKNTIYSFSLSKAGLPGERIGILVANEEIIETVLSFQSNLFIHPSQYGQVLATKAIKNGMLLKLCKERLQPFYVAKQKFIFNVLQEKLTNIPWRVHSMDGALFAWLHFGGLPISDKELYRLCQAESLFIVPGSYFFFGLDESAEWQHQNQCIRVSLTASDEEIIKGIGILKSILEKVYSKTPI